MFNGLTLTHWLSLHGVVAGVAVLLYVVSSHVMHQRRHPAAAIAWMLFILLLPYLALPAYVAFGSRKLARPRSPAPPLRPAAGASDSWAVETLLALGQPAPAAYDGLRLHAEGHQARERLLAIIHGATRSIDLSTFILGRDELGRDVVEHLRQRALQGVRVRLLLDGMGSLMKRHPDLQGLRDAGADVLLFVPPWRPPQRGRSNLRNHRKLLVADAGQTGARLWCGGRNLAAEYFDGQAGQPPWRDLSFDLQGPLVAQAATLFDLDWAFAQRRPRHAVPPDNTTSSPPCGTGHGAQLVASGPDQADDTLHALLVTAAYRAAERIALATPYFVPEPTLLMALCLAARRGVQVDLLLPERSNHRLSDLARGRALRSLAQAGGRIWLAPGMMHAKLVVVDRQLALAGSANIDSRSLFLNYELMVAFHEAGDVQRFADWFDHERASARAHVAREPGLVRDIAEGMLLWVGFQL